MTHGEQCQYRSFSNNLVEWTLFKMFHSNSILISCLCSVDFIFAYSFVFFARCKIHIERACSSNWLLKSLMKISFGLCRAATLGKCIQDFLWPSQHHNITTRCGVLDSVLPILLITKCDLWFFHGTCITHFTGKKHDNSVLLIQMPGICDAIMLFA